MSNLSFGYINSELIDIVNILNIADCHILFYRVLNKTEIQSTKRQNTLIKSVGIQIIFLIISNESYVIYKNKYVKYVFIKPKCLFFSYYYKYIIY